MAVPGDPHVFKLKLWNQVQFLGSIKDRIDNGIIRFKVNRDVITLKGVNVFGVMPELVDPNSVVGISINRVNLELYDESDNSMVAKSYAVYRQNDHDTDSFTSCFREFPYLKPNQIYRLEFEYSGPKRRYGNGIEPDLQEMYCGRAGTVAVDIVERKLRGTRLVDSLLFQIAEREQLKPTFMDTKPDLDVLQEDLKKEMASGKEEHFPKFVRDILDDSSHLFVGSSEVLLFTDVGFHDKAIEKKISKGSIRFRVNKRIELKGMTFFGMLSIDEEMKDIEETRNYDCKVETICVKECDGACYAMGPEKWAFSVPSEEKVPLSFIKLTLLGIPQEWHCNGVKNTPRHYHSWAMLLGPSEWYTMEFDLEMPAFRFGKTLAPTQEVDCGLQGKVVFEFDLEKTVNAEAIHSFRFSVSEDQTVEPQV